MDKQALKARVEQSMEALISTNAVAHMTDQKGAHINVEALDSTRVSVTIHGQIMGEQDLTEAIMFLKRVRNDLRLQREMDDERAVVVIELVDNCNFGDGSRG